MQGNIYANFALEYSTPLIFLVDAKKFSECVKGLINWQQIYTAMLRKKMYHLCDYVGIQNCC